MLKVSAQDGFILAYCVHLTVGSRDSAAHRCASTVDREQEPVAGAEKRSGGDGNGYTETHNGNTVERKRKNAG